MLIVLLAAFEVRAASVYVRDIKVEGLERVEVETVLSYVDIKKNTIIDDAKMDASLKQLYATGLFNDVSLNMKNDGLLIIKVAENPIINKVLFDGNDKSKLKRRISETFPDKDDIRQVYEHLAYFYQIAMGSGGGCRFEFNIDKFCMYFHHFPIPVNSALKILSRAGYIEYENDRENMAQLTMLLRREDLYRLEGLDEHENAVVIALLRNYGGLFSDYCYIDESLIAMQAGISKEDTYGILKDLSRRRILHFIPRKQIPHVKYTQSRVEADLLVFSKDIYDDRKKEYEERINSIINYAENNDICRSRQLLRYFGEERSVDCSQCDVCINHNMEAPSNSDLSNAEEAIMRLLADGCQHNVSELAAIRMDSSVLNETIEYMISEEKVFDNSHLSSLQLAISLTATVLIPIIANKLK